MYKHVYRDPFTCISKLHQFHSHHTQSCQKWYVCVCVCVCVERERERERESFNRMDIVCSD